MITAYPAIGVTIALLTAKLPAVHAGPVVVSSAFEDADEVVRVDRLYGGMSNMVTDAPQLLVECWARQRSGINGDIEAETLANHVRAVLTDARSETYGGCFVRGWFGDDVSPDPDPDRLSMVRWKVTGTLLLAAKR